MEASANANAEALANANAENEVLDRRTYIAALAMDLWSLAAEISSAKGDLYRNEYDILAKDTTDGLTSQMIRSKILEMCTAHRNLEEKIVKMQEALTSIQNIGLLSTRDASLRGAIKSCNHEIRTYASAKAVLKRLCDEEITKNNDECRRELNEQVEVE